MAAGCAEAARTLGARAVSLRTEQVRSQRELLRLATDVAESAPV
jgi:hypothetical protein